MTRAKKLNKRQVREVKRLFKEGLDRRGISKQMNIKISQVYHVLKKQKPQKSTRCAPLKIEKTKDYKALYLRALKILIENDLLDVDLGD